jgi:hypothetical protein
MEIKDLIGAFGADKQKEVEELINGLKLSGNPLGAIKDKPELFGGILKDNPDFAKVFDAEVSSRVTKGLETGIENWKTKNLDKLYQDRYSKENPAETPEQKRIAALEIESKENRLRAERAELKSTAIAALTTAKVESPADLAALLFDDGKEPLEKVKFLADHLTTLRQSIEKATTDKILKDNGRILDDHEKDKGKYYTPAQIEAMSDRELHENKGKVLESMTFNQNLQ